LGKRQQLKLPEGNVKAILYKGFKRNGKHHENEIAKN
jgi:hypothetical protein